MIHCYPKRLSLNLQIRNQSDISMEINEGGPNKAMFHMKPHQNATQVEIGITYIRQCNSLLVLAEIASCDRSPSVMI